METTEYMVKSTSNDKIDKEKRIFIINETINKLHNYIPVLKDAHKKTPVEPRLEVLIELEKIIVDDIFLYIAPYFINNILPILLERLDDKPIVAEMAFKICSLVLNNISIYVTSLTLTIIFKQMVNDTKWRSKLATMKVLMEYITRLDNTNKDLLTVFLPVLIKNVSSILYDTKKEVADYATSLIFFIMKNITNKDLEPFIGDLVVAMKDRDLTDQTIHKLAGIVFIQTVEGSVLSVVIPLMLAGFRDSKVIIKRMCSRIISNMVKLVENPLEIEPFLDELIPILKDSVDIIPDPEARNVALETYTTLNTTLSKISELKKKSGFWELKTIKQYLSNKSINYKHDSHIDYSSYIIHSLITGKIIDINNYFTELSPYISDKTKIEEIHLEALKVININLENTDEEGHDLCQCEFTLAYGTKILLHNTKLCLKKGYKYGLLGQNDSGKSTLMRSIANNSLDGFPDSREVKTVFVEADIQGELSHLNCVNYILEYPAIKALGATEEKVREVLKQVGFTEGKSAGAGGDCDDPISSLSGGWRMKLALARAMLQQADILLMDEPTNHLDVKNVKWVEQYINSLKDTTVIIVSHDSGLLDNCCNYIIQIKNLKLELFKGNLSKFVETNPEAKSYFEFKTNKVKFSFPQPCFLEGIKSRGKALLKMDNVSFLYPGNTTHTIKDITIRASMGSRVACVGINGAGKSTMIKVLTGELEPTDGNVWKYPNTRIGYIAQHAFHHIENHLDKTPNDYIQWRFEHGDDREGLDKASMQLNDNDMEELLKPVLYTWKTDTGERKNELRVITKCTGQRKNMEGKKKMYQYEVSWKDKSYDSNSWLTSEELIKFNKIYEKMIRMIDHKISARENMLGRALTKESVETHLTDIGLEPEYATHYHIKSLSGGQKVKVVLAAAMWDQPHILILDEPTNYLDRDSLGALADAIESYEGGIIMITHNDAFCRQLCPERWILENGRLNTEGDIEWMNKLTSQSVEKEQITEMVNASGNTIKLKAKKNLNSKEKRRMIKTIKEKINDSIELDSDEENYAIELNL
jgi:elongation factor 3